MSSRETVLHVRIVSGRGGGPEKTILNSARFLEGTAYRSIAVYLHAPGDTGIDDLAEKAREKGSPFVALTDEHIIDFKTLKALRELCKRENVAIWHGHDYKSNLYGLMLRKKAGFRLVTTVHGWVKHTYKTPIYYAVDRWCIRRYEQVVCVSSDLEEQCLAFGVKRDRLQHIPNAIDTEEFRTNRESSHSAEPLVIGAVGRLSKEKGFDLLITAVAKLVREGLDLELHIAGEGEESQALADHASSLGISDRVKLLGFQSDTVALFDTFDLFCLASLREGLPNVVLEAMSMEVPVLATRCGGMESFAVDRREALLCPTGSAEALAAGLRELATDQGLRTALAKTARARIEADYSFETRMRRIAATYDAK